MQPIFIGREQELTQINTLFCEKKGGVYSLQGESGSGKSYLLEKLRLKYHHHPQFFLNCKQLPYIQNACEFLLYLSEHNSGFKNLTEISKKINENNEPNKQSTELFLLEALAKDCKSHPIILVDAYEHLLEEPQIFIQRINSHYSRLNKQPNTENILYAEWLIRLLQFLKQQGALLIIAGIELDNWQSTQVLKNFNAEEILKFAKAMKLNSAIAENHLDLTTILKKLSFGGNPFWLRLACHFLILELNSGKNLSNLIYTGFLEDYFSSSQIDKNLLAKNNACKLALFKQVMPPHQKNSCLIALPNFLDAEILNCLFGHGSEVLRHALTHLDLLSASTTHAGYLLLHDEIKTLLLNEMHFHDLSNSPEIKNKHKKLAALYQRRYLQQVFKNDSILVEVLYHQLMEDNGEEEQELEQTEELAFLIALAIELQKTEDYSKMTQVFFRFITIAPEHNEAWYSLGMTLSKQERFKEAVAAYQKQLHLNPEHDAAWKNMGFAFYQLGEVEQAVSAYQKKISVIPEDAQAWEKITIALYQRTNLEKALKDYQQKLAKNPKHETAHYNLGVTFKKLSRMEEAVTAYKEQLQIDPQHDRAWNNMGTALFKLGNYAEATTAFSKALKINPSYLYALTNDAELALIQNDSARCLLRVNTIMSLVGDKTEEFVVSPFLIWLSAPEQRYHAILKAIEKRQPKNHFNWSFEEIEPVVTRLNNSQQKIARSFISYFSNNLSFSGLQKHLKNLENT
ncbi:MAG: tetratricopeptide repeat protein [Methylococcaceae bacterium]|nr:tetratricopeptide repeat protein [Methylococcaceae bacterium]